LETSFVRKLSEIPGIHMPTENKPLAWYHVLPGLTIIDIKKIGVLVSVNQNNDLTAALQAFP
jgi:hypothetical protein